MKCAMSILLLLISLSAFSIETRGDTGIWRSGSLINREVNPHFTGLYCKECHDNEPVQDGDLLLRFKGDFSELCWCHGYTSGTYIHPVDITPSEEKKSKIPPDFPLRDEKMTCSTCHDIYEQCQKNESLTGLSEKQKKFYKIELMFLRGASFARRTTLCFKCHDEERYKKMDPHNQLDAKGQIIIEKCLYCHEEVPSEKKDTFGDVKLLGDLKILCQRCHGYAERHPANIEHYRKPTEKTYKRMKKLEKEHGVVFPFDHEGKVTCITCHNPHERGVIPYERAGAKGASEIYRHRLPQMLCRSCHGM